MATPKSTVSTEIIPYIFYRDVPAALDWLTRAFGFAEKCGRRRQMVVRMAR